MLQAFSIEIGEFVTADKNTTISGVLLVANQTAGAALGFAPNGTQLVEIYHGDLLANTSVAVQVPLNVPWTKGQKLYNSGDTIVSVQTTG